MATKTVDPETITKFSQPLPKETVRQDSHFLQGLPHMSEAEIYEKLGYADAGKPGGLDKARREFKADHPSLKPDVDLDHNGNPTLLKLDTVMKQAIADREKFMKMGADGITPAQAYGITTAAQNAHVKPESIATLAIAERAFDKTFTESTTGPNAVSDTHSGLQAPSREPGLIQMTSQQWLETVREFGNKFPGTEVSRLADQINKMTPPDSHGNRPGVDQLDNSHDGRVLRAKVLALRNNPVVSAEIGAERAAHNPVQLDIMKCYAGYTGAGNEKQLSALFRHMGLQGVSADPQQVGQWCAVMANAVLRGVGDPGSDSFPHEAFKGPLAGRTQGVGLAGDFSKYGKGVSTKEVKQGDVVIFPADGSMDNDPYSHVAIVSSVDAKAGTFEYIGGNQGEGHSSVKLSEGSLKTPGQTFRSPPPNSFAAAQALYAKEHKPSAPKAASKPVTPV